MTTSPSALRIGERLLFFRTIDSTNTKAGELAQKGEPEGTVVIADAQTRGRGRLERTWQSPPGRNLYLSIILRPHLSAAEAPQLTLMAGVAVAEALETYVPGQVSVKWPNDVLLGKRKICGILTEMTATPRGVDVVVVGVGVNVNMVREDFEPSLRETATSLRMETGQTMDRLSVAGRLFESMETWYRAFQRDGFPAVRDPFLRYSRIVGQAIRVVFREDTQTGVVEDIDRDGAILLRDAAGAVHRIAAGDVHLMKG